MLLHDISGIFLEVEKDYFTLGCIMLSQSITLSISKARDTREDSHMTQKTMIPWASMMEGWHDHFSSFTSFLSWLLLNHCEIAAL
jgi:hypothetical protein